MNNQLQISTRIIKKNYFLFILTLILGYALGFFILNAKMFYFNKDEKDLYSYYIILKPSDDLLRMKTHSPSLYDDSANIIQLYQTSNDPEDFIRKKLPTDIIDELTFLKVSNINNYIYVKLQSTSKIIKFDNMFLNFFNEILRNDLNLERLLIQKQEIKFGSLIEDKKARLKNELLTITDVLDDNLNNSEKKAKINAQIRVLDEMEAKVKLEQQTNLLEVQIKQKEKENLIKEENRLFQLRSLEKTEQTKLAYLQRSIDNQKLKENFPDIINEVQNYVKILKNQLEHDTVFNKAQIEDILHEYTLRLLPSISVYNHSLDDLLSDKLNQFQAQANEEKYISKLRALEKYKSYLSTFGNQKYEEVYDSQISIEDITELSTIVKELSTLKIIDEYDSQIEKYYDSQIEKYDLSSFILKEIYLGLMDGNFYKIYFNDVEINNSNKDLKYEYLLPIFYSLILFLIVFFYNYQYTTFVKRDIKD